MTNDMQAVSDDLRRARRNMLALSVVIIAMKWGVVSVTEVAILGTKLSVQNPIGLYAILWAVFGYFVWRYFQRLAAEPDLGVVHAYMMRLAIHTFDPIHEFAFKQCPGAREYNAGEFHIGQLSRVGKFERQGHVVTGQDAYGSQTMSEYTLHLLSPWLWAYHARALLYVLFVGDVFTEYFLPSMLALIAAYIGFSGWDGGMLEVIQTMGSFANET